MNSSSRSLIFLGTGTSQGIPVIGSQHPVCLSLDPRDKRFRSSVYIQEGGKHLLIDCGPDFRMQMLQNDLSKVDAILFTHEHNDHVIGLDDVRPIFFEQNKEIELYGLRRVLDEIKKRFPYSFVENKYPGVPEFSLNPITENPFEIENIVIQPIPVMHGKLPILGYKFDTLAYLTDVSNIPDESMKVLQNLDVLIINVLRKQPKHYSHLVLDEALEIVSQLRPKKTYFTHISHYLGFHEEVQDELPENIYLAYDGLEIDF